MNTLCKMFGHQPPVYAEKGWYSPGEEYGVLSIPVYDHIGRGHSIVFGECARCGATFKIARVHITSKHVEQVDGPDYPDGPWSKGYEQRTGTTPPLLRNLKEGHTPKE